MWATQPCLPVLGIHGVVGGGRQQARTQCPAVMWWLLRSGGPRGKRKHKSQRAAQPPGAQAPSRQSAVACPLPREPAGRRPPVLTSHLAPVCGGPGEKGAGRSQVLFSKAALGSGRGYQGLTGPCLRAGSWLPACSSLSCPFLCNLRVKSLFLFSPCHRFCPWSAL